MAAIMLAFYSLVKGIASSAAGGVGVDKLRIWVAIGGVVVPLDSGY